MSTWCPPQLYFYLNFWTIKLSESVNSKNKKYLKPFFREIEWEKAYLYTEAIGFSGFVEDVEYSCHRKIPEFDPAFDSPLPSSCYKEDGTLKTYVHSRDYLRKFFPKSLGKPLYENEALNIIDMEGRETGKSYWASGCIAHNWLFDGYTDYDKYLQDQKVGVLDMSETLVGAIDTKFSSDLMGKVEVGLTMLPGEALDSKGRKVPSPLAKQYTGSFKAGNNPIKAGYEQRVAGGWTKGGTGSLLHHRGFSDNPLAGNGTRPGKIFLEEIGFFGNLLDTLGALRDCTTVSGVKFGTINMMGTGGDMTGGSTLACQTVFYNPEEFDCVAFPDLWENTGKSIGFFCPPYKADIEFLDKETGKIDEVKGLRKLEIRREKLKKGKDKTAYNKELENKPLKPSEVFLTSNSNKFPIAQLKDQLGFVQSSQDARIKGTLGEMVRDQNGKADFKVDLEGRLRMPDYPIKRGDNDKKKARDVETEGAVCVWDFPKPGLGYGYYASGQDPFSKDDAPTSVSVGSFLVIERGCVENGGYDRIVAEYTGRPESGSDTFNETCLLLLEWYNHHECLIETNVGNFKAYVQNRHKLHLLALTPGITQNKVKDANSTYGIWLGNKKLKNDLILYVDNWLRKPVDAEGKLQLQYIYSEGLLKELIGFNEEGNFDRVSALCCAVTQSVQLETIELAPQVEPEKDPFWSRKLNTNHRGSTPSSRPQLRTGNPQHPFFPHGR